MLAGLDAGLVLLPAAYGMLETGMTGTVTTFTAGDEADTAPVMAGEGIACGDAALATGQTVV
jgi:hypothetical protein